MGQRIDLTKAYPLPAPLALFVEPTNACNFRCSICPESFPDFREQAGYFSRMDRSIWKSVVKSVTDWSIRLKALQLYFMGEPLLNPEIGQMISDGKTIADRVEINSNASQLNEHRAAALIESGLDCLRVSVYSTTNEGYRKQTGSPFGGHMLWSILENVKELRRLREQTGSSRPHIVANLVTVIPGQKETFLGQWGGIADEICVRPIHTWNSAIPELADISAIPQVKQVCPLPFYEMFIHANGDISACCADWNRKLLVGNIREQSLQEIWEGDRLRALWRMQVEGRRFEVPSCKGCIAPDIHPDNMDALVPRTIPEAVPDYSESSLVKIGIGDRRYGIRIKAEGYEMGRTPAKVLEMPHAR